MDMTGDESSSGSTIDTDDNINPDDDIMLSCIITCSVTEVHSQILYLEPGHLITAIIIAVVNLIIGTLQVTSMNIGYSLLTLACI